MKPLLIAAALTATLILSGCVSERRVAAVGLRPQPPSVSYIVEKRRTPEPFAHVMFCEKTPEDCRNSARAAVVRLTATREEELTTVNRNVNSAITPVNDPGNDIWTLSPRSGDCEDYAVTKRHVLIQHGWPDSALRLAIATTAAGEGHLVLVVHIDRGDMVLDNRSNDIRPWLDSDLKWQSIQSPTNPRVWFHV